MPYRHLINLTSGKLKVAEFKAPSLPEQKNQPAITQSVPEKTVQNVSSEPMFGSPQDFIRKILPMARQAAEKAGLDPLALVAQSALESGWGRHMMQKSDGKDAHNFLGLKRNQGGKVNVHVLQQQNLSKVSLARRWLIFVRMIRLKKVSMIL